MGQESKLESQRVRETTETDRREGPLLSWRVNPSLAGPGLNARIPGVLAGIEAGLD